MKAAGRNPGPVMRQTPGFRFTESGLRCACRLSGRFVFFGRMADQYPALAGGVFILYSSYAESGWLRKVRKVTGMESSLELLYSLNELPVNFWCWHNPYLKK